jgi:alpha-beta hydrolase superfamily lysophospholipase
VTRRALWVALAGCGVVLGGCALVGEIAVAPHPSRVGPPPADLGAEAVGVPVPIGPPLAGWYLAAEEGAPGVVLLHGITDSRVHLVGRARLLREAGYAVLLVDLPGHGESPGRRVGYGWPERHAAAAAVGWLRARRPRARVGVVGISLGGAAATLAGPALNADAVVLEMVYPTFRAAVGNRVRRYTGPLAGLLTPVLVGQSPARIGAPADSLRPVAAVARLGAPVFVIGGAEDPFTPPAETRALYAAAPAPKDLWVVEGGAHEDLLEVAPEAYRQRVVGFLSRHLGPGAR